MCRLITDLFHAEHQHCCRNDTCFYFKDGKYFAVRPVAVHISCHIPLVNQIAISKKNPFVCVRNGLIVPLKKYLEQRKLNFGCMAYNVHNSDDPLILI